MVDPKQYPLFDWTVHHKSFLSQAADDVTVYVLREADYVRHMKEENADKRAKYSAFLASVPFLSKPRVFKFETIRIMFDNFEWLS